MEAQAKARFVRITPRKARQVIDLIRGKDIDEAFKILAFVPKNAADVIENVLKSAVANAEHNHKLQRKDLFVADARADQGPTLKRFMPRAMGRAAMIHKRTSHITVVLREK
ncbi:MAG: 50S ribosomal protein L22 [Bacillota bacterium]